MTGFKHKWIVFLLMVFSPAGVLVSQDKEPLPAITDDPIASMLDSLANLRYFDLEFRKVSVRKPNKYNFAPDSVPRYDDKTYTARLAKLDANSPFDLVYHEAVKRYIDMYALRKRGQVERMMGLSELYFPLFEETLDRYNLPLELKYLAIIESALNPTARSRAGAVGLWQFMYGTGKMYNLRINSYVDERCDPYKSTVAACEYLKFLYDMFGNWEMVLAAYNSGPGTVNRAIRRSGGKKTYWEIRPFLPRETQSYVPAFIAVNYVMNHMEEHNLYTAYARHSHYQVDTVTVKQQITFGQVSAVLDLPVEEIQFLNPTYRRNVVPFNQDEPYKLTLPAAKTGLFITNEQSIYNYLKTDSVSNPTLPDVVSRTHTVKKGEHLSTIARRYKCSVNDIREWNNLKSNSLKPGRKLVIYIRKTTAPAPVEKVAASPSSKNKTATPSQPAGKYRYHTIQTGDTLWNLAQKNGTTVAEIKRLNNFGKYYNLLPGQKIKLPAASGG